MELKASFAKGIDKILNNTKYRKFILLIFCIDLSTTIFGGILGVLLYLLGAILVVAYIGDKDFLYGEKNFKNKIKGEKNEK